MIRDRDFTRVTFKVNTAGSWANLVTCDAERVDEVKAACAVIGSRGEAKFKYVDAAGGEIECYGKDRYGHWGWHAPKRGRS